jgi:flagellar hook-associated protein 2
MASVSFSGLGSGLDTDSIVEKLVAVEKAGANALTSRKTANTKKLSVVADLVSKLQAFKTQATSLSTATGINAFGATSNDTSRVKITANSSASVGVYNLKVNRLAQAETTRSRTFGSHDVALNTAGTLDITVAGATKNITYDGTDTLDSIAAKINDSGAGATASVLFDGSTYRLNVTSKDTGVANAISFGGTGDLLGFDAVDAQVVDPKDSEIELNGTTITRSSNSLSDVATGVTFDLVSETPVGGAATQLQVTRDTAGVRAKMQGLVDAFNAIAKAVSAQTTYTGDGSTQKGGDTLFGDPTVLSLQRDLGGLMAKEWANGNAIDTTSTGRLGISLGRDGTLTLDAAKFDAAVAKDPKALVNMLTGTNRNGLAAGIEELSDRYTSSTKGLLTFKKNSITAQSTSYDKMIDKINENAESLGARLRKQFTAMESLMSKLNSQTSYIDKIFATKADT